MHLIALYECSGNSIQLIYSYSEIKNLNTKYHLIDKEAYDSFIKLTSISNIMEINKSLERACSSFSQKYISKITLQYVHIINLCIFFVSRKYNIKRVLK